MPAARFALLLPSFVALLSNQLGRLAFTLSRFPFRVRLSRACRRALDPFVVSRLPLLIRRLPFVVRLSNPFAVNWALFLARCLPFVVSRALFLAHCLPLVVSLAAVGRQPALSLSKGIPLSAHLETFAKLPRPSKVRRLLLPLPLETFAKLPRSSNVRLFLLPLPLGEGWGEGLPGNHPGVTQRSHLAPPAPQTPPQCAPPRLKSFLEKTLNAHETAYSAPQTPRPAAPPSVPAAPLAKALLALPLIAALLAACDPAPSRELHVFAAASLRQAIADAADAFQAANPGVRVVGSFAGSQVLRLQVESGARADLFVSANPDHLDALQRAGLLRTAPAVVAANQLVLAVPAGNPAQVTSLHDLTQPNRRVVMAGESVPAGAYARRMLALHAAASGQPGFADAVLRRVISFETNVRQVAAKLELGEADAGFVYRTDVLASDGRLHVVETSPQVRVVARYPAAVLRDAPNPELARRFLVFLRSPEAQAILASRGFGPAA